MLSVLYNHGVFDVCYKLNVPVLFCSVVVYHIYVAPAMFSNFKMSCMLFCAYDVHYISIYDDCADYINFSPYFKVLQ